MSASIKRNNQATQPNKVFALDNVVQLRQAVDQTVYGEAETGSFNNSERTRTIDVLTTTG